MLTRRMFPRSLPLCTAKQPAPSLAPRSTTTRATSARAVPLHLATKNGSALLYLCTQEKQSIAETSRGCSSAAAAGHRLEERAIRGRHHGHSRRHHRPHLNTRRFGEAFRPAVCPPEAPCPPLRRSPITDIMSNWDIMSSQASAIVSQPRKERKRNGSQRTNGASPRRDTGHRSTQQGGVNVPLHSVRLQHQELVENIKTPSVFRPRRSSPRTYHQLRNMARPQPQSERPSSRKFDRAAVREMMATHSVEEVCEAFGCSRTFAYECARKALE